MAGDTRATFVVPDDCETIALCGGAYSNFAAVEAFLVRTHGMPRFCLGDLGGFGPHPDRTLEQIRAAGVACVQGNYDHAVGFDARDCGCGYVDPRDREYAQISFDYTAAHTGNEHKAWMRSLPSQILLEWREARVLLVHGSPDSVNEFVWESETGDALIEHWLERERVDGICATHSGIPWMRFTRHGFWCNVGVLGRPAHEHTPRVGYATLRLVANARTPVPELRPLQYDVAPVVAAMRAEGLPEAFAKSLECGLWTTCYNILPAAERTPADRFDRRAPHALSPTEDLDARDATLAEGD